MTLQEHIPCSWDGVVSGHHCPKKNGPDITGPRPTCTGGVGQSLVKLKSPEPASSLAEPLPATICSDGTRLVLIEMSPLPVSTYMSSSADKSPSRRTWPLPVSA